MSEDRREFTGRNGAEVRDWVDTHTIDGASHFITKGMTASSGGQAWRYVRDGRDWPTGVTGAVYDPVTDDWLPVQPGDHVVRRDDGSYTVEREGPCPA